MPPRKNSLPRWQPITQGQINARILKGELRPGTHVCPSCGWRLATAEQEFCDECERAAQDAPPQSPRPVVPRSKRERNKLVMDHLEREWGADMRRFDK